MTVDELRKEIETIIEERKEKYECYGIRVDYTKYEPGDICEYSHELWQDYYDWMTDPDLPGTMWKKVNVHGDILWDGGEAEGTYCCLPKDLEYDLTYPGDYIHLVASDGISGTDTDKEYLMVEPVCLASWNVKEIQN